MNHGYFSMRAGDSNNREYGIFLFLVFCGFVGLAFLKFGVNSVEKNTFALPERTVISTTSNAAPPPVLAAGAQVLENNVAKPNGSLFVPQVYPEVGMEAEFILKDACKGVVYQLELGKGGPMKEFKNGILRHAFPKVGNIVLTLFGTCDGRTESIQNCNIYVVPAVEEDDAARVVDR